MLKDKSTPARKNIIAFITDFGDRGHFTGVMKGVILKLDPSLTMVDITHNIEPQNILEAAYTLKDALPYFPGETIFVVVVDPGVGMGRKSLAVRTRSGHCIVCPDNGILTEVLIEPGLEDIRIISESMNRLPGSEQYHTFHGRDIFAYDAGRLASGIIQFPNIGFKMEEPIVRLPIRNAEIKYKTIEGAIVKVEHPFGNISTNISRKLIDDSEILPGDGINIEIFESDGMIHQDQITFVNTFGEVGPKSPLAYIDSSNRLGLAINQGNFASEYKIKAGLTWWLRIRAASVKTG